MPRSNFFVDAPEMDEPLAGPEVKEVRKEPDNITDRAQEQSSDPNNPYIWGVDNRYSL